jgi:hypothetical protein
MSHASPEIEAAVAGTNTCLSPVYDSPFSCYSSVDGEPQQMKMVL